MGRNKRTLSAGDQSKAKSSRKLVTVSNDSNSHGAEGGMAADGVVDGVVGDVSDSQTILSQSQSQSQDIIEEALDFAISQGSSNKCLRGDLDKLSKTVAELKETVRKQQITINELIVLIGSKPTYQSTVVPQGSSNEDSSGFLPGPDTASTHVTKPSYADATASCMVLDTTLPKPTLTKTVRQAVLTAVHSELLTKHSRERNIIITGLRRSNSVSDKSLVCKLLFEEFGVDTGIVLCKRLGKSPTTSDGRPQPLRVVFSTASVARDVLTSAKYLRNSADMYVRENVFVNADLTRAEAEAAYHARCARRRMRQLKNTPKATASTVSIASASGDQPSAATWLPLTELPSGSQQSSVCTRGVQHAGAAAVIAESVCLPHQVLVTADIHQSLNIDATPFTPVSTLADHCSTEIVAGEGIVSADMADERRE